MQDKLHYLRSSRWFVVHLQYWAYLLREETIVVWYINIEEVSDRSVMWWIDRRGGKDGCSMTMMMIKLLMMSMMMIMISMSDDDGDADDSNGDSDDNNSNGDSNDDEYDNIDDQTNSYHTWYIFL